MNRTPRLLAGALVLALPLGAAAGCGAEKQKTVRQEFKAAQSHLADSRVASFTLRLDDAKGSLAKLLATQKVPSALAQALVKGSITYVADPAGDRRLRDLSSHAGSTDAKAALKASNLAFVVRDDAAILVELRVVEGDLFAHVDLAEVSRLAKAAGVGDVGQKLDQALQGAPPQLAKALTDVRAGKWLRLPLSQYVDQLKSLAEQAAPGTVPTASAFDAQGLGARAYAAVKPYVKVTEAAGSSGERVLDVDVRAKPAVKALLGVLQAERSLPFAGLFSRQDPTAQVDKALTDGQAHGTIRLRDSHLKGFTLDLESVRRLAADPGTDSLAGLSLVVDVDDAAQAVTKPQDVSTVDLGALFSQLAGAIGGQLGAGLSG